MALKAKYCSQCGAKIATRTVEDRQREVCSECETVFYRNPLPVAAAVVLSRKREVLLVKRRREPQKGMWCLPIGFAEMGETIADAACRELKEEAGIDGQVLRLLDVTSHFSAFYGDLLIVTFEVAKVGGVEQAGDDAEDVAYFPLDRVPPLAFSSNEKALAACAKIHEEEWAIQDSFEHLQADEGKEMLSDALVALVEEHSNEITRLWVADVRSNATTKSYRRVDPSELFDRGDAAVAQFGRWFKGHEADEEVRVFYRNLGRERQTQGMAVHEVFSSLTLLRKHLWAFSRKRGFWERPIEVYRVLELNRRIAAFFDRAMYHMARGFEPDPPA